MRERIAERLIAEIKANYVGAIVDDWTEQSGGAQAASPSFPEPVSSGNTTVVSVNGEDAVWCEFGAGVFHNGSVGNSPNPYGADLGFAIGTYGKNGQKQVWCFKNENGETIWTRGTPASMPMYRAVQTVVPEIPQIAKEVFGSD